MLRKVLQRGSIHSRCCLDTVLQSLCLLLPTARDLDGYLQSGGAAMWLKREGIIVLLLQHGARSSYTNVLRVECLQHWKRAWSNNRKQHIERFVDLLRAADTDFSGVRQRIDRLRLHSFEAAIFAVIVKKLCQPLTLQTSCVISVRRQLRAVCNWGMWPRIDTLILPTIIKDRLKLIVL